MNLKRKEFHRFSFRLAEQSNIPLAKYVVYSDYIRNKAEKFLNQQNIKTENLLALHIRNGEDFVSFSSN